MEFQKHHHNNSKQFKRTKNYLYFLFGILYVGVLLIDYLLHGFRPTLFIVFSLFIMIWIIWLSKGFMKLVLKKTKKLLEEGDNSGILGNTKFLTSDDGFIIQEPESESKAKWSAIKKFEETEDHYYLYLTTVSAIIIPKKEIENKLEELDRILKSKISN